MQDQDHILPFLLIAAPLVHFINSVVSVLKLHEALLQGLVESCRA